MAMVLKLLYQKYDQYVKDNADVRLDNYFLMGSPLKVIGLSLVYLWFVKRLGPKFMAKRQPYNVRNAMLIYNLLQVLVNAWLCIKVGLLLMYHPFFKDKACMIHVRTESLEIEKLSYLYYIIKVIDYMDTIFMVLRKNFKQATFLHVYHHILMALCSYYGTRFIGGGHGAMMGFWNTFVHAVMYFYYFMSAFHPELKKSMWWKKHITQLQILQFTYLGYHFLRPFFHKDCEQPWMLLRFSLVQVLVMMSLFTNFYIKTYIRTPKVKAT